MTANDFTLLGKKILVGILVALLPFFILVGGLSLLQKTLQPGDAPTPTAIKTNKILVQ